MSAMRKQLLMGANRDSHMGENKRNYYDPDVCRLFLAGLCPHDLLLSTQMDIGLCSKVHSLQLRKDFEETNPKGSESFGRELEYVIGRLIALCDRKGQRALKKLTDEDAKAATAISVSEVTLTKDVLQLSEEINEKTKEVHTSDFEGRTDEHIMAQKVVDELRAKRADMQATLFLHALNKDRSSIPQPAPPLQVAAVLPPDARTQEMINEKLTKAPGKQGMVDVALKALEEAEALEKPEPSSVLSKCTAADVRTADRKLRFCDICGTIFSVHENFRLFSEHFGGKLHLGFMLIREKQKELQEQSKRRKDECEGSLVNERDMDFISNLSDDLLGLIITRLDIHEGARTTILSHRWKSLWQKAPLNFDDKYIKAGSTRERISIVVQVFNKHRGSFRRVIFHHAPFKPLCHWCEVGMFNNLDQISLDLNYENLPECVQCLPLVRSVCLNRCVIKANSYFRSKKLALLELRYCRGAGKFFTFMFSQSENTETLMLVQNFGHHTLRFHSIMPRLRRLFVVVDPHMFLNYNDDDDDDDDDDEDDDDEMKKLIVEKMENLEQLYLDQRVYGPNVDISDCPKLIFCGCLGWGNSRLRLNNARFYGTECSQVASFASVETFAVHMLAPNLSQLMDFLWCLPCLKTLHIMKISESESWYPASESGTEVALMNTSEGIQCMENTLMKVVLWGFSVDTALEFMQHFINHARFLDSITYTTKESILPPVLDSQFKTLKLGTRKSAKVHVNFACQIKSQVSVYMDYSSDPFGAMLGETYHKISE